MCCISKKMSAKCQKTLQVSCLWETELFSCNKNYRVNRKSPRELDVLFICWQPEINILLKSKAIFQVTTSYLMDRKLRKNRLHHEPHHTCNSNFTNKKNPSNVNFSIQMHKSYILMNQQKYLLQSKSWWLGERQHTASSS